MFPVQNNLQNDQVTWVAFSCSLQFPTSKISNKHAILRNMMHFFKIKDWWVVVILMPLKALFPVHDIIIERQAMENKSLFLDSKLIWATNKNILKNRNFIIKKDFCQKPEKLCVWEYYKIDAPSQLARNNFFLALWINQSHGNLSRKLDHLKLDHLTFNTQNKKKYLQQHFLFDI